MKPVKFRAYVPAKHCYMKIVSIEVDNYKAILRGRWDKANSLPTMKAVSTDTIILEQYTGFTDNNGKEIYEGDLLSVNGHGRGKVYFEYGAFRVVSLDDCTNRWTLQEFLNHFQGEFPVEVTGNIHEEEKGE